MEVTMKKKRTAIPATHFQNFTIAVNSNDTATNNMTIAKTIPIDVTSSNIVCQSLFTLAKIPYKLVKQK